MMMPDALRSAIAADLAPVRPLAPPLQRALAVVPFALLLLFAAPVVFDFRDLTPLGWLWSWGASIAQVIVGVAAVALALREAVPGREWSGSALAGVIAAVAILFLVVTVGSWSANPVALAPPRLGSALSQWYWWQVGAMCAVGSAASALPAVVLSAVLVVRAFPLRPARTGALAGLGGGLLADAGWRLFCHYSEPAHVVVAHLGGVLIAVIVGAMLTSWLVRRHR